MLDGKGNNTLKYRLPKGTRIRRTYLVRDMKGKFHSTGKEDFVTTKDAIFTDEDVARNVHDVEAIEFRIPDLKHPTIIVALRDLETLCKMCGQPFNVNFSVMEPAMCGPCWNNKSKPDERVVKKAYHPDPHFRGRVRKAVRKIKK